MRGAEPWVRFEDEHLLAVDKPAGVNTHRPDVHAQDGMYEWVQRQRPGTSLAILHRLDKETSGVLLFGKLTHRPLLKLAFGEAFPALDNDGWRKLTRNWILFCLVLAGMNEVLRRTLTTDQWVDFKVWGVTAITFAFALAQSPILSRHAEDKTPKG